MRTLPPVVALATIATLLAGCSDTPGTAADAGPQTSGSPTSSASSSATSSSAPTSSAGSSSATSSSASSAPTSMAASPSTIPAAPSPAPSPAPTPAASEPGTGPASPQAAVPTHAPVPEESVGPPPAPTAPGEEGPAEPAVPAAPEAVVVPTSPDFGGPSTTVPQGGAFTVVGSGYEPGQEITITFGYYRSDVFVMDDQTAVADADGTYSFRITVGPNLEARTYGIMTYEADARERAGSDAFEASKQYAVIEVVAT
ncbi:hypothetical protein [uncultured Arthrobacter sp.]|uniref:hypothetical protein n=1 Tax=uncultured Arthrobacter sp. TaxID=114050 RepID=UPI002608F077|nr:hypothetical protein [uncultured Arthrobacter sp.]